MIIIIHNDIIFILLLIIYFNQMQYKRKSNTAQTVHWIKYNNLFESDASANNVFCWSAHGGTDSLYHEGHF